MGSGEERIMGLDYTSYAEAKRQFRFSDRWAVFDGNRQRFNIAHECVDRHPREDEAVRITFDDGRYEVYTFGELSRLTSQFAHLLRERGVEAGDRVAVVLNPSLEFYVTLFGTLKRGAVLVPCFPAFGPDALSYRLRESRATMVVTSREKAVDIAEDLVSHIVVADELLPMLRDEDDCYAPDTAADSLAITQFSSGTTGIPKIVPYTHAAATLTAVYMKMAIGLQSGDEYACPSSPAWGHGIWYGSVGPLVFGKAIGAYSGKFQAEVFQKGLERFAVSNVSATPLVYRLMMESGKLRDRDLRLRSLHFTGGPLDMETIRYFRDEIGIVPRTMYGSTEVGVVLLDYPFADSPVKPGSLGRPMLGLDVAVLNEAGETLPPGEIGQIAVRRGDRWVRIGDAAYVDEDGYFWYKGRMDDVIISAGYTIGPQEIEEVLEKHPAVRRAAVIGSPDLERGEIVKAFIVGEGTPSEEVKREIQEFVRTRLSKHEYPREIEFVETLPETPDGKVRRQELRERERISKGFPQSGADEGVLNGD